MVAYYVTEDGVLVGVAYVGSHSKGRAKWQVLVHGGQYGEAVFRAPDVVAPPRWAAERVARHAVEWAQSLDDRPACQCADADCPGKDVHTAREAFGPTDPLTVGITGPFFQFDEAAMLCGVRKGLLDEDRIPEQDEPSVEDLVRELDGKPPRPKPTDGQSPDPFDGSTWRLG